MAIFIAQLLAYAAVVKALGSVTSSDFTTAAPDPHLPSSVTEVNIGAFTLSPKPSACTASTIPFQTSVWVQSNQMEIEDDSQWWDATYPTNWTFWTDTPGVVFGQPSFPGSGSDEPGATNTGSPNETTRMQKNSFTLMSTEQAGNSILYWAVYQDNGTAIGQKYWNYTGLGSGTTNYQDITYQLHVEGSAKCAHPRGNSSCAANSINASIETWEAYGMDDWFKSWFDASSSDISSLGVMQAFSKHFNVIESGAVCSIGDKCASLISNCKDLADPDQKDAAQVYLAWISIQNLSDLFQFVYSAIEVTGLDALMKTPETAVDFAHVADPPAPKNPPLGRISATIGGISGLFGLIPPLAPFSPALGATAGFIGAANAQLNTKDPGPDPKQYAINNGNLSSFLGDYITSSRYDLVDNYNSTLQTGTNLVDLLSGGKFLDRSALQLDDPDRLKASQLWMNQFLELKMINYMWYTQNVFITFMPYGKVTQVDSSDDTDFDESACASNFKKDDEADIVVCNTDDYGWNEFLGPGMARLTWYNSENEVLGNSQNDGSLKMSDKAPGADTDMIGDSLKNFTNQNSYNFSPAAVIESSMRAWIRGGFNNDDIESTSRSIVSNMNNNGDAAAQYQGFKDMQNLFKADPSASGFFNLPVCVMTDLNMWPTYYCTPGRPCADAYCACGTGINPAAVDKDGMSFTDAAPPALADRTKNIMGKEGKRDCYYN